MSSNPPSCFGAEVYQKTASWEAAGLGLDRVLSDPKGCTLNHDMADASLPAQTALRSTRV